MQEGKLTYGASTLQFQRHLKQGQTKPEALTMITETDKKCLPPWDSQCGTEHNTEVFGKPKRAGLVSLSGPRLSNVIPFKGSWGPYRLSNLSVEPLECVKIRLHGQSSLLSEAEKDPEENLENLARAPAGGENRWVLSQASTQRAEASYGPMLTPPGKHGSNAFLSALLSSELGSGGPGTPHQSCSISTQAPC